MKNKSQLIQICIFHHESITVTSLTHEHTVHIISNTLLKSDVTRRDHVSVVMDPMNAGSRIVNFIVNFIRDGTVFA